MPDIFPNLFKQSLVNKLFGWFSFSFLTFLGIPLYIGLTFVITSDKDG